MKFAEHTGRTAFTLFLLLVLCVNENAVVLLSKYTRSFPEDQLYKIKNVVLMTEGAKLLLGGVLECLHSKGNLLHSVKLTTIDHPSESLKIAIPAVLYLFQNTLVYVAISNLSSPLFQVAYQSKLVTTAIISIFMLKRSYTLKQWACLGALSFGVALALLSEKKQVEQPIEEEEEEAGRSNSGKNLGVGLVSVGIACFLSALTGVYFEKVLKQKASIGTKTMEPALEISLFMRNIQLAFFTIVTALGWQVVDELANGKDRDKGNGKLPFFHGFTAWVWALVVVRAVGGFVVAAVIKYSSNVIRGIATGVSVIVGCTLSIFLFGTPLTGQFVVGALLVLSSCYLFSNDIPTVCRPTCRIFTLLRLSWVAILFAPFIFMQQFYLSIRTSIYTSGIEPHFETFAMTQNMTAFNKDIGVLMDVPPEYKEKLHFHVMQAAQRMEPGCGGCQMLWKLYYSLIDQGYSVSYGVNRCPEPSTTMARNPNRTVVIIYPEVSGTTCQGIQGVIHVRWMLAEVGVHNKKKLKWGEADLAFNYATSTGPNIHHTNVLQVLLNPVEGDATDISYEVFHNKSDRSGIAWMMRKGPKFHGNNLKLIHEQPGYNWTEFDGMWPTEKLREFEFFVTYDPYTYWSWLAAMSGTISVVYPLANTTRQEWEQGTLQGSYLQHLGIEGSHSLPGVAYGWSMEEIDYARKTMKDVRNFLMDVKKWGDEVTVPRFARDCYRHSQGERLHFEGARLVQDIYGAGHPWIESVPDTQLNSR